MRMMVSRRLRPSDERGATIVIVVIVMVAIIGMLALVVDAGGLLAMRRRVVTATDAAALAAAQSFAGSEGGVCGSAGGNAAAQAKATTFAQDNVGSASVQSFAPDCANNSVKVQYQAPVKFFFAQVIGAGSNDAVPATSTAIWGPVGRAKPAPIMVFESQLAACGIPDNVPAPEESIPCDLTYNTHAALGPPYWGELDLSQWNSSTPSQCHVDANELVNEIEAGGWHDWLDLNTVGTPTPDCADNGRSTSVFAALEGKTLTFPVVADTALVDGGSSGGTVMNVIGFVKVTVTSIDNGSTITLHTEWAGPSSQAGIPVVGGQDFGQRAVRLVG
jgi:Flp pilus assembly protein TadG